MPENRRPTMSEVAASAGVSLKTVSRVVNGVSSVDPDLASRVHNAIERMGYQRNLVAAGLKSEAGTRMVGLITTDLSDPFFAAVANAVDKVAREQGFQVMMTSSGEEPGLEQRIALSLCQRQVQGLIIVPSGESLDYLEREVRRGLAVVFVDRPGHGLEADCVLVDNYELGKRMASLLVSRGHRRIGIVVGSESIFTHRERFRGIQERLEQEGVPIDPELVVRDVSEPLGAEGGARRILGLPDPPSAVICTNNRLTLGLLSALCTSSHVAEVVAFDDPEYSDILPLPMTLIAQDPAVLGTVAAERLFARLAGDHSPARTIVVPTELVVRGGRWPRNLGAEDPRATQRTR